MVCAKFKPPGSGKCLGKKRAGGGKRRKRSGKSHSKGGGSYSLGVGPAIRSTARLACSNPARMNRAMAIRRYLTEMAVKESQFAPEAKGKGAYGTASKSLVKAMKQWDSLITKKCLPGKGQAAAQRAARDAVRKARKAVVAAAPSRTEAAAAAARAYRYV